MTLARACYLRLTRVSTSNLDWAATRTVIDDPRLQLNFTVYSMPMIEFVTPSSGPAIGGTFVRVHGANLDALLVPGVSMCRYGGGPRDPPTSLERHNGAKLLYFRILLTT